jgi:hypothetical protein
MLSSSCQGAPWPPRQFLLEDLEVAPEVVVDAAGDVAVDSVLGALSGLTILPASDPSITLYELIAGRRVPPASAPLRLCGGRPAISASCSATSGLTEVPSLHSAPALGAGRGFGGLGGWRVASDVNAFGKLRKLSLVLVGRSEGLCFGLIRVGGKCFCHYRVACRIKTHSTKFHMGCNSGWFIAAKGQQGTQNPSAFITPFLDLAKMTKDTLTIVKGSDNKRTTAEWEVLIAAAQAEWEEFDAQRPLRAVMEQSSGEEGHDESIGSTEGELFGGCYFSPENFGWKKAPKAPVPLKLTRWEGEEPKGNTIIAD